MSAVFPCLLVVASLLAPAPVSGTRGTAEDPPPRADSARPDTARAETTDTVVDGAAARLVLHGAVNRAVHRAEVATELARAADSALPYAREIHGDAPVSATARPTVHAYVDEASWRAAAERLARGASPHEAAFEDPTDGSAHVLLRPTATAELLAQTGAPLPWKRLVAHAAVHAFAARALAHAATLPTWWSEGVAQWACERGLGAGGSTIAPDEDPFRSTQALALRALARRDWLPAASAVIDGLPGGLTPPERAAFAAVLFDFLRAPERASVFEALRAAARAPSSASSSLEERQAALSLAFERTLAAPDARDRFDDAFVAHVLALTPAWDESFRALWPVGDGWAHVGGETTNALAWRTAPCGAEPYAIEGDLAVLPGESGQMNVLLARAEHAFVQVSFTADFGVDVFEFDARAEPDARWRKLATARAEGFGAGAFHRFRVVVEAPTITVWLDGKPLCAPRLEGHDLSGAFGLGVLARTSGLWRGVTLRRL